MLGQEAKNGLQEEIVVFSSDAAQIFDNVMRSRHTLIRFEIKTNVLHSLYFFGAPTRVCC